MLFFAPESLSQAINPWSWWSQCTDNTAGFVNIVNYKTENPTVEKAIVHDVAGYGMQLDAVECALEVVVATLPTQKLTPEQNKAIEKFNAMLADIREKKEKLAADGLCPEKIDKLIDNLRALKDKNPARYESLAGRLKAAL